MSRVNKRKHVLFNELGPNDFMPPTENQQFARVVKSRGNNLHEVEPADSTLTGAGIKTTSANDTNCDKAGSTFLVSMPHKFRKNIWIRRDNFIVIEMISEGHKVKGEIVRVLMPEHVRQFKKDGIWPAKFDQNRSEVATKERNGERSESTRVPYTVITPADDDDTDSDSDDADLVRNTNGWHGVEESDNTDESGSDSGDDLSSESDYDDIDEKMSHKSIILFSKIIL